MARNGSGGLDERWPSGRDRRNRGPRTPVRCSLACHHPLDRHGSEAHREDSIDLKLLAADVGGTHARFATFRQTGDRPEKVRQKDWSSEELDGLGDVLRAYLEEEDPRPERACLALAGPVEDGRVRFPNLGWEVEQDELAEVTGIPSLRLINDFDAVGHGVPLLRGEELATLQEGETLADAPVTVVGAGTGLGVAYLDRATDPPTVHSSEGGHMDFAPRNEAEQGLARFLVRERGRASWERVLSGRGLADVYRYLVASGDAPERPDVREEMRDADPAEVISRHGLAGDDALSVRALEMFVSAYGSFAGNMALAFGARGGVFVAGGIAPRILDAIRGGPFMDAFLDRGRMREYVEGISVTVVLNGDVGLLGAAAVAARAPQ